MKGIVFSTLAFTSWGLLPLYWKTLGSLSALDILAHRIVFALAFALVLLAISRKPSVRAAFRDRETFLATLVSSLLIGANWFIYIFAVNSGKTIEASIGYYMNPLFSVALGLLLLKERLTRLQWAAMSLAAVGVALMTFEYGRIPLVAIALMVTFGLYGFAKKRAKLDTLTSLAAETLMLAPAALCVIAFASLGGAPTLFSGGWPRFLLLALSGPITALPLWWFALGARSIPLSSVGFFQFISPTIQLALGIFVFGEPFGSRDLFNFSFVWAGLLLYALSYVPAFRQTAGIGGGKG